MAYWSGQSSIPCCAARAGFPGDVAGRGDPTGAVLGQGVHARGAVTGSVFAAQLYYVAIITPVIHYCMGGLVCGELCSFGPRFSGHLRSVRGGAVLGQGRVPARCWATTGPHGPDSAETRAVLGHGC